MHHLLQGISADEVAWLSASTGHFPVRVNVSEHVKRRRLAEELLFWLYDGFVIPLIRVSPCWLSVFPLPPPWRNEVLIVECAQNAFYVTETGTTRNKTVYFRLDDWADVCKPVLRSLRHDNLRKLSQVCPRRDSQDACF